MPTSYHFSELVQEAAVKMGTLAMYRPSPVAIAIGSDRTNIADSTLALTVNEMAHALAIVTRDAGGLGAAPEGEWGTVISNTATIFTFAINTFSANVEAGDEIMIIRPKYPLAEWRRSANVSLKSFGEIPLWDTSITLASGQTEYTLPAAVIEPLQVFVQTNSDSGDNQWLEITDSTFVVNKVPGTAKALVIASRFVDNGKSLAVVYNSAHPSVYNWNDHIDIPIELAASKLAWEMVNRGGITDRNRSQSEKILSELNDAIRNIKIPNKVVRKSKLLTWSN
jgi:hypothetical protein